MNMQSTEFMLFGDLIALDHAAREAELARLETQDAALVARLRRLLAAHDMPLLEQPDTDEMPASIGAYHVLERLGQGGMGDVYLCEQSQPVSRKVAVKVLRAGMDTREVLARFDAERQALALMTHANIARMLDAGESEAGWPYFVMEYVPGVPLLRYCRENRLSLKERLRLFITLCAAVQHAHQKGVIHRDIKPSNILVVRDGDTAVPRIIDFGIAKALGAQLTARTLHTITGNLVGTPEYMSPEQADIGAVDIDTRADIYSLGVVLYELVSGTVPHRFTDSVLSLPEIQRTLRSGELLPPSAKLLAHAHAAEHAQTCGFARPAALAQQLRGDLDAIALKALQKHRARRYASATELAEDVARHLADEPVDAARARPLYLAGKFLKRNAAAVACGVLLVAMLLSFTVYTNVQARALAAERDYANQQAAKARQVGEFFADLFANEDGSISHPDLAIREALDIGAHRALERLAQQPDVQVALLHAIGRVYNALGLYREAEQTLADAMATATRDADAVSAELLRRVHLERAQTLILEDRPRDAEPLLLELSATAEARIDEQYARLLLGEVYMRTARHADAERLLRDVMRDSNPDDPAHGLALLRLGELLAESSRFDEAQPLLERGIALLVDAGMQYSPEVIYARGVLMWVMTMRGETERARTYVEETLDISRRIYGEEHPATAMAYSDLSYVLFALDDHANAERELLKALDVTVRTVGEYHTRTAITLNNLASVYDHMGRREEALELYRRVLDIDSRLDGPRSSDFAGTLQNIGYLQLGEGDTAVAEETFRQAIEILREAWPEEHWMLANAQRGLGMTLLARARYADAEQELCAAQALYARSLGDAHDRTRANAQTLAELYAAWQQAAADKAGRSCP